MGSDGLDRGLARLRRRGAPPYAERAFTAYHERLVRGDRGLLAEADLRPVGAVSDVREVAGGRDVRAVLGRVAVVRLNGGLATTLHARGGKGQLPVSGGLSFVDLACEYVQTLRRRTGAALPHLLMANPLQGRPGSPAALDDPTVFLQSVLPRLRSDDLTPVDWPADESLEWAPAGHGDVFAALASTGMLGRLLAGGYEHACIASIDNVAFGIDPRIPEQMAREGIPFVMEVTERTADDRKGGHLARLGDGRLVLRETAQTPAEDLEAFQDVERHRFFNTNTLWVDLQALDEVLRSREQFLDLPLIANRKTVDPDDPASPEVIQIETAMGTAISVFPGAEARNVGRDRFFPVKTTAQLLAVRSDAYQLTDDRRVVPARSDGHVPSVELDPRWFGGVRDLDERFPAGPPSLIDCQRLTVRGDVRFGRDVVVRGTVVVDHRGPGQQQVPSGAVLVGS